MAQMQPFRALPFLHTTLVALPRPSDRWSRNLVQLRFVLQLLSSSFFLFDSTKLFWSTRSTFRKKSWSKNFQKLTFERARYRSLSLIDKHFDTNVLKVFVLISSEESQRPKNKIGTSPRSKKNPKTRNLRVSNRTNWRNHFRPEMRA